MHVDTHVYTQVFGPLIPIARYTDLDQVVAFVNARPKPLAL